MIKKIITLFMALLISFTATGCFKSDSMEDISIYTTVYPIMYITERLYGDYALINSIYPDGVIPSEYKLTSKQIKDYSSSNLFIFNGLGEEKDYVTSFFKKNKNIMIIDSTASMEFTNRTEELWLNPSNLLMIAQNIKTGLNEYVTNHYIKTYIEDNYDDLKLELSNLDADISIVVENANNKNLIVTDDLFLFLSKYGFNVISLDKDTATEKTVALAKDLLVSKNTTTIFAPNNEELSDLVNNMINETGAKISYLQTLSNITEDERNSGKDYISIMKENLEKLKAELY